MADRDYENTAYSTLEVASPHPRQSYEQNLPEAVYSPSELYLGKIVVDQQQDQTYVDNNRDNETGAVPPLTPPPKRICGLSRTWFWLVIGGIIIVAGALAGGLAGGLLSRNHKTGNSDNSANNSTSNGTTIEGTGPLAASQLAALNWTDSTDTRWRTIFYQNNGALFYNQYHTSNSSWTSLNLSAAFESQNSGKSLSVQLGTPLAVAAPSREDVERLGLDSFIISLYYVDANNYVRDLYTKDESLSSWSQGNLSSTSIKAAANTHLAASAFYCPNDDANWVCNNQFTVYYQDPDGYVRLITGPDWADVGKLDVTVLGASIAMFPFASNNGGNITDVSELRFFYYSNSDVLMCYQNLNGLGRFNDLISSSLYSSGSTLPQIVASPANFHSTAIILTMDGTGDFTAAYDDHDSFQINQQVTFTNEDGSTSQAHPSLNLTSLAIDHNGTFYGISSNGSAIISYSWDPSSKYDLTWKETISVG
ncbi:hypothetical protein BX600DRAFT_515169 [Xylariales sp. PMI_506]|nr:hypothetical protein BX600DRAFT_515169 [Xylariales sp. PMI_506]